MVGSDELAANKRVSQGGRIIPPQLELTEFQSAVEVFDDPRSKE